MSFRLLHRKVVERHRRVESMTWRYFEICKNETGVNGISGT